MRREKFQGGDEPHHAHRLAQGEAEELVAEVVEALAVEQAGGAGAGLEAGDAVVDLAPPPSPRTDNAGNAVFDIATNAINVQGNIQLSPNWAINVGNFGYDFRQRGLSFPSFGFSRDLHCWSLLFNWQPTRGTYNFSLAVKPGTLDFIKIPNQRNVADPLRAFE